MSKIRLRCYGWAEAGMYYYQHPDGRVARVEQGDNAKDWTDLFKWHLVPFVFY